MIVRIFPEYTPHDSTRHLDQLFPLADRVLGADLSSRLNAAELSVLVFALYAHDWGMAVSQIECEAISRSNWGGDVATTIPNEVLRFAQHRDEGAQIGSSDTDIWEDYLRRTHAQRSAFRLRTELAPLGHTFAEMAAVVAEGHTLDLRDIRDAERYPQRVALMGQVANVAIVAA